MKDIVQFCDKTIPETTSKNNKTKTSLKSNINREQLKAIKSETQSNEKTAKKILQQPKFSTFNNLKHKPKSVLQPIPQYELEAQEQPKKSLYSDMLKRKSSNNVIKRKSSETNIQPNKYDTIQILKSLTTNNTQAKVPPRSKSSAKQSKKRIIDTPIKTTKTRSPIP